MEVYKSSFGGQINYERDGVLTCSIVDCIDGDFFERYTITSDKNFEEKLKYIQTLVSSLYYKIITEQEFEEMLNVV